MTTVRNPADNLDLVIEYLENHPDIFIDQPELLNKLNIPHDLGKNMSSLIEYQVKKLRQTETVLKEKLTYFHQQHQAANQLSENLLKQQEILLSTRTIEELYSAYYDFLNKYFGVNYLLYFVFVNKRTHDDYRGLRFRTPNSKVHNLFVGLFNHKKPICDCLHEDYLDYLFGKKSGTIQSTAIFPVQSDSPQGLMIIASREANRFKRGINLNLLNQMKSLFLHQLFRIIWK